MLGSSSVFIVSTYLVSLKPPKPLQSHYQTLVSVKIPSGDERARYNGLRYQEHQPRLRARFRDFSVGGRKRAKPNHLCSPVGQGRVGAREVNARVYREQGVGGGGKKKGKSSDNGQRAQSLLN